MYRYYIGIDCGVNTGISLYDREHKKLLIVDTESIHTVLNYVHAAYRNYKNEILVVVEDARQVRFNTDKMKAQGAGSVKRDAKIWADFLEDYKIPHLMVRPKKAITKLSAERFKEITGWSERTNEHGRDAAMLVWGATYTPQQVLLAMEKLKGAKAAVKIKRNNLTS